MNASRSVTPFALGTLWFAAAVSLAEIATGGLFSGAGFSGGTAASLAGHLVGAAFFCAAGWISLKKGKRAIAVCEGTFGRGGPVLFGILNFIQLVGWTAVMIIVGARSLQAILTVPPDWGGEATWRLVLGLLILLWATLGPEGIGSVNAAAALALAGLCVALSAVVFGPFLAGRVAAAAPTSGAPGFGSLFELAVVMPLSWLPLVGDYLVAARRGRAAIAASATAYTAGSLWMYALGLAAVIAFGTDDPVSLMGGSWKFAALAIVLLSTVTTAFLDGRSAGISLAAALPKIAERVAVFAAAALGLVLALAAPVERYETFLLFIGAVFAPLYAVLFADFFFPAKNRRANAARPVAAFACWAVGVAAYFLIGSRTTPLGTSLPVMALVALLFSLYRLIGDKKCA